MRNYTFIDIADVIKIDSLQMEKTKILAHISENRKSETLEEHTARSIRYFLRLMKDRKLETVFNNFIDEFLPKEDTESERLFEKMMSNIIVFHDYGKINPSYQKNILGNKDFPQCGIECLNGSRHSMLSSVIYFDYFMNEVNKTGLEENVKQRLKYFVLLNSYIISRHHSDLAVSGDIKSQIEVYAQNFTEGNEAFEILNEMKEGKYSSLYVGPFLGHKKYGRMVRNSIDVFYKSFEAAEQKKVSIYIYTYVRFLYSILISCDYYATSEYMNGIEIRDYGNLNEIDGLNDVYERTERICGIRKSNIQNDNGQDINILRNKMFLECEENLLKNKDKKMFFLEAPTGSGKSNMSVNISLKLLDETIRKIIYVYPFNTLIEQNIRSLNNIFGGSDILNKVAVINSISPIKRDKKQNEKSKSEEDEKEFYQKVLLDRQFLNYPFILTTHVNLFDIMFGSLKESAISFYQLSNSVIVLDEIQSYKNNIWTEIMYFLQCFSELLNIKVVIMSATLPQMDYLTETDTEVIRLITNRNCYFEDKRFKERVKISYELLNNPIEQEELLNHMLQNVGNDRTVLVEFIRKSSAYKYYDLLKRNPMDGINVYCLTGDYNQADREKVLKEISSSKGNVLVATQVVEAGVDIDMDIGYKNISKLDSEEQFLGRINRNYKSKFGKAYFFQMDNAGKIYKGDFRIEPEYTIIQPEIQEILLNKKFDIYYQKILKRIKEANMCMDESGIEEFIQTIKDLKFYEIQKRMELIEKDDWYISIFIPRIVMLQDGNVIDGNDVWEEYKVLLKNNEMDYAEKQVKLSDVKSKLNYFVYKVNRNTDLSYNDRIGEMYLLEDGEQYLEDGHLNLEKVPMFI